MLASIRPVTFLIIAKAPTADLGGRVHRLVRVSACTVICAHVLIINQNWCQFAELASGQHLSSNLEDSGLEGFEPSHLGCLQILPCQRPSSPCAHPFHSGAMSFLLSRIVRRDSTLPEN
jgi:hypothetical protein